MKLAGALLAIAIGTAFPAFSQSYVQISSIRARPTTLTCLGIGATTHVRVQIYAAGLPDNLKNGSVKVNLAVYSAHPAASKMDLRDSTQEIALSDSPLMATFEVNCTGDTLRGVMTLGATIVSAPEGLLVKEPNQQPLVELKIEPPL